MTAARMFAGALLLVLLAAACSPQETAEAPVPEADPAPEPSPPTEPTPQADEPAGTTAETSGREATPATPRPTTVANPREDPEDFHAGMAVLMYGNDEPAAFEEKTRLALDRLVELEANAVSLAFPLFQDHFRATEVYADPEQTPSIDRVRHFVEAAHERRFTVMLRPTLDEQSLMPDGQWRGSIQPRDRDAWFASYGDVLMDYVELAAEEDVELVAIGTELTSLQGDTERWDALVERLREAYDGELTYAANFDAFHPDFAGSLEWLGVDAFFPLDAPQDATVEELVAAWEPWREQLQDAGAPLEQVLFTELGVRAQEGAHRRPYVWQHGTPADAESQRRYYEAACESILPELGGVYWWKVDFDFPEEAQDPESFSPLGRPAEDVVRECFRELAS